MTWGAVAAAGAVVVGGMISAKSSRDAASQQSDAARQAAELQNQQYQQSREDQMPWMNAGRNALTKLEGMTDYTPFGMDQFQADPGYSFRLSEGMKGLERSAAARGGLLSGATLKGIQNYGQQAASQEYSNAFNRYQVERAARLQPLQSLAGVGQTSAAQIGSMGMQNAQIMGNNMMGGANARASGYVGQANALNNAIGQGMNYYQGQQFLNRLPQYGGGGGSMNYAYNGGRDTEF